MKKKILLSFIAFLTFNVIVAKDWHVSTSGSDNNKGTKDSPLRTISKAAFLALAGDTVTIHQGTYREWVSPANTGINSERRIVYMAAPGEAVDLKGSEQIKDWHKEKGVWIAEVDNKLFGDFNPFDINISGDWLMKGKELHLGEVYINGKSLKESLNSDDIRTNEYSWFAKVSDDKTVIIANFGDNNPNKSLSEINVRPTCFFPKTTGINYITVKGLKISQAATQWSAPTSEQIGIIGPNWSKGWVIEDCEISDSKCVGICLGKDRASGHNMWTLYREKFGYTKCGFSREIEAIFKAYDLGWSKENIGSHLIQNNVIHDCNQAGIVGHMGSAFSTIRNNQIFNINRNDDRIGGAETAGIKLHAAIDVRLEHNFIENTVRGIWLDWQAQGTQIVGNIIDKSFSQDLFLEVSHGPTMIYNNIFLSDMSLALNADGVAVFNNLIYGRVSAEASPLRYTPYHEPHSTKIKGIFNATGGDIRFYNNIFLGNSTSKGKGANGLIDYDKYPEYSDSLYKSVNGTTDYIKFMFPVWASNNIYYNQAKAFKGDRNSKVFDTRKINCSLKKESSGYYIDTNLNIDDLKKIQTRPVNSENLGYTFISESVFDNPDGTSFILKNDILNNLRNSEKPVIGPFENMENRKIW